MAGTQFIGKDAILAVYGEEYGDEYPWAMFQGKKRRAAGIGSDELGKWIDRFSPAGSSATYVLCVYDEAVDPEKVSPGTESLACWDFKINAYQAPGTTGGGALGKLQQMMETDFLNRLNAIEARMNAEPDEPEGIDLNKIIMDYIENPHKIGTVMGAIKNLLGGALGGGMAQPAAATIGAFGQQPQQPQNTMGQDEQLQRICNAIDRLQVHDPQIVTHLERLAHIAENDPLVWSVIKSKLDGL